MISNEEFRTRLRLENVYKINDSNGLVIQKKWKRMLVLVNVEPSKLVVSFSKVRPRKKSSQPMQIGKTGVKKTMTMMRMIQSFSGAIG